MKNNNYPRIFYLFHIFKVIFVFSCQSKNDMHMNSYELLKVKAIHSDKILKLSFNTSGDQLALTSKDKYISLWDTNNWKYFKTFKEDNIIKSICFHPKKDNFLALGDDIGSVIIKNFDGKIYLQKKIYETRIKSICFSPNGYILAFTDHNGPMCLINIKSKELLEYKMQKSGIKDICFSPNGNILASAGNDKHISLLDINTFKISNFEKKHENSINSICFNKSGNILVSGDKDGIICIWNINKIKFIKKLFKHSSYIKSICFNSSGNLLASADKNGIINLFNTKNWSLHKTIDLSEEEEIACIQFHPLKNILAIAIGNSFKICKIEDEIQNKKPSQFDCDSKIINLNGPISINCDNFINTGTGNFNINKIKCKSYIDQRDQSNQNISKIKIDKIINSTINIQNCKDSKNVTKNKITKKEVQDKKNNIIYTDSEEIEEKNNDHISIEAEGQQSIDENLLYQDLSARAEDFNRRARRANNTYINHMNISGCDCEDCRDYCKKCCKADSCLCLTTDFLVKSLCKVLLASMPLIVCIIVFILIVTSPTLTTLDKGTIGTIWGLLAFVPIGCCCFCLYGLFE